MFSRQVNFISFIALLLNMVVTIVLMRGASSAYSQAATAASFEPDRVSVTLHIIERTPTRLKFHLQIRNSGDHSVLIISDSVRIDGSEGMYISLGGDDSSLLEVSSQVFPPPNYTILAPKHRVTYRLLYPGTAYEEEVLLKAPLSETEPPWREMLTPRNIDLTRLQSLELKVGVLPDEPGVRQAFAAERSPTGLEIVKNGSFKGKPLFEIQSIVSSDKVKL
jgi:hypothetical protein